MAENGHLSDSEELAGRVADLEAKVKAQDDELVCLKSALSEAIRRLNHLENNKSGQGASLRIAQKHNASSLRDAKPAKQKPAVMHAAAAATKPENHLKKAASSEAPPSSRVKSKDAVPKDAGEGTVKIFIKGRPVTFYAPTALSPDPLKTPSNQPPKESLALEWVYGYRGKDCRSNIFSLASGDLLYFTAAIAVLHDVHKHTQRHYLGHNDDIKCMAVHPDKTTVATGQVAGHDKMEGKPHVRIWSSVDLSTLKIIGLGDFDRGVAALAFSKDGGGTLAVVDEANDHVMSLWEWAKGEKGHKLLDAKTSGDPVFFVDFNPSDSNLLVTCGKSHINFWTREGASIAKKAGIFEKLEKPKFVTSLSFNEAGDVITGDSNGTIHVWAKGSNKVQQAVVGAHEGGVFCITACVSGHFLSGGKDRQVVRWRWQQEADGAGGQYVKEGEGHELAESVGAVRQVTELADGQVVVGTTKNHILIGKLHAEMTHVVQGLVEETWGLDGHPGSGQFVTCGHDKLLQVWDAEERKVLRSKEMPEACHALSIHPDGELVVVTSTTAKWHVLQLQSLQLLASYADASERVECVQFSPDGSMLACGSRDNFIYVYSLQQQEGVVAFQKVAKLSGHSSFVLHVDWSDDGQYLQSNSGDYELLFWNMATFKQLLSPSSVRDVTWKSNTCALSFATCGVWPDGADGTDINACSRSHNRRFVASADDYGKVNLFSYPCFHPKSTGNSATGHSSHVTNVSFLQGDERLVSVGGKDASVLQWRIVEV